MLREVLIAIGVLCLLGIIAVLASGRGTAFLPHLIAGAVILGLGVAFEQWRYKRVTARSVDPHWQDTGERFVDPETGATTAVYFDPRDAQRHYIARDARGRAG